MGLLEEFIKKSLIMIKKKGVGALLKKVLVRFKRDVLGKNFYSFVFYTSYSRLWGKVFESHEVKNFPIFFLTVCMKFVIFREV